MICFYSETETFKCDLDITAFLKIIDCNKAQFKHIYGIDNYIDNWKKALVETYNMEQNMKFKFDMGRNFFTSIYINSQEIRLHFNIEEAIEISKKYPIQNIPLSSFSNCKNEHSTVKYTECYSETSFDYAKCDIPIIIVQYQMDSDDFYYLTIDGNHRITAKINNKLDDINLVLLNCKDASSLIKSKFERAVYLFLCECQGISMEPEKADLIINNSYYRMFM